MICRLQSERGEVLDEVRDPRGCITACVPPLEDQSSPCWRFIDPYGDTIFNCLQMEAFLVELDLIVRHATPEQLQVLEKVWTLARRCRDETHLYLKFEAD